MVKGNIITVIVSFVIIVTMLLIGMVIYKVVFEKDSFQEAIEEIIEQEEETGPIIGLPNPASVNCEDAGYTLETREDTEGNQFGVCIDSEGNECEEWSYFRGECTLV